MSSSRPHILFLPRWYPNRYDPMPGLFIRYQAEALAASCDITVLYIHSDPNCPNRYETEFSAENGVNVIRVYYQPASDPIGRWRRFYTAHIAGLAMLGNYMPDLIHVHVLTRQGVMGALLAGRMKVPYVISEHWSRYFPENDFFRNPVRKWLTRLVVGRAAAIITVSGKLREAMKAKGLHHPSYHVVPNVLDMDRFRIVPTGQAGERKTALHVSCFDDRSKNISGLLEAVRQVCETTPGFVLRLVGDGPDFDKMKAYARRLGLGPETVVFPGLKEGEELVAEYGNASFSVLSSRFETFGTVVPESLACGTPVLATAVGIAPELVNARNGILVEPGNTDALAGGLIRMLDLCESFDREEVRGSVGDRFTPASVSAELMKIYTASMAGKYV